MSKTMIVYSKYCLECLDERWLLCRNWLIYKKGYVVKFRRTALNPIWHKLAASAYGTDDYPPFAIIDGKVKTVRELEDEYEKEMSKVRRNTTKKSTRVGGVARKKSKAKKEA